MPATDKLLLDAWRTRRDPDAFGEIVRRHASMVYATCRRILRNDADAEDVTQDCFLRLAQAGNGVKSSLVGWLHWMATRRSLDYMKRESRRRRREAIASSEPRAKEEVSWEDVQPHIDEAIDSLPVDLREIIVRHYLEQESLSALGRRLGLSHRTVGYRAEKGVRAIRAHLRSAGISVAPAVLTSWMSNHGFAASPPSLVAKLGKMAVSGVSSPTSERSHSTETTVSHRPWTASMSSFTKAAAIVALAASLLGVGVLVRRTQYPRSGESSPAAMADLETTAEPTVAVEANPVDPAPPATDEAKSPTLSVRVVWAESAEPVPQARVKLIGEDDGVRAEDEALGPREEGTTDELGAVKLEYPEAWTEGLLVASHELAVESQTEVELPSDGPVTLRLEQAYVITGSVVDSTSGTPIPGAIVRGWSSSPEPETRADEDGVYLLRRDEAGKVSFVFSADGYARRKVTLQVTERGRTVRDVPLNPALDVLLVVVDTEGNPVEGVELESPLEEGQGYAAYESREPTVTVSDYNGEARLFRDSTFRRRSPSFNVKKEGYSVASIGDLEPHDGAWSVRIVLALLSRNVRVIEGHVRDEDGNPVAGALVGYNDGSMSYGGPKKWKENAATDANGFYRLRFTNRKKEFLFVAHGRGRAPDFRRDVSAGTPEKPAVLDFTLKEGHWLSGRVTDEGGHPIERARVKAIPVGPSYSVADILPDVPHQTRTES